MIMQTTVSKVLKELTRTYYSLLAVILLALLACSLISNQVGPLMGQDPQTLYAAKLILYLIVATGLFVALYFPARFIKNLNKETTVDEKLKAYKKAQVLRFMFFGVTSLTVSAFFLLTADSNIILVQAIVLLFMIVYKPSAFKLKSDLSLTTNDCNEPPKPEDN